jgi:hypothetical protein
MKRYERLGMTYAQHICIERRHELIRQAEGKPGAPSMVKVVKNMNVGNAHGLALAYFCDDQPTEARVWGQNALELLRDLFFGEWRKRGFPADQRTFADEKHIRTKKPWLYEYRRALFWSLVLGDETALMAFAKYAGDDCADESISTDFKASDRAWYIMLARFVRGEHPSVMRPSAELIESERKKKPKLMLACLIAIATRNQQGLTDALSAYLKYFKAHEFPGPAIDDKLSIDGSILVHVAERAGMRAEIYTQFEDHIVRL